MFIPMPESINDANKANANYSLLFHKWVRFEGGYKTPKELKDKKILEFIHLKQEFEGKSVMLQKVADAWKKRVTKSLLHLRSKGLFVEILSCKVSDALICGIGDEHPLENSIRLDHCTGLPYIPASSIKGVARFAAEFNTITDKRDLKEDAIFGSQTGVGDVQFWDGFPAKVPTLKIDIMNNHFQAYYSDPSGSTAPSDDMNPNPVPFIVVDAESEFCFPVVAKNEATLGRAISFLQAALSEWGVGAKTSVGYGLFYDIVAQPIKVAEPTPPVVIEPTCQVALKSLEKKTSPENFVAFLQSLTEDDEGWLRRQDLFAIPNFNVGFAAKLFEAESVPLVLRQIVAKMCLKQIDLKKATKAAGKGDTKDLDRYNKLKELLEKRE